MKKLMTIDNLAKLMINTMASKEDLAMLATKEDLNKLTGKVDMLAVSLDDLQIEVQKIDNKISRVEQYKVLQLELIKLLREKKVITTEESHKLLTV